MLKLSISAVTIFSIIGLFSVMASDKCSEKIVSFDGYRGTCQCDYSDKYYEHYRYESGIHHTWAYANDYPHDTLGDQRNPRSTINLRRTHPYTKNDVAEFSAEVFVPSEIRTDFSFFAIRH